MVDPMDGRLYLATKSIAGNGTLFAAPMTLTPGDTHDLVPVEDVPFLITDGSFTPDGNQVVLLQNRDVFGSQALVYDVVRAGSGVPMTLQSDDPIELPSQQQPESMTITRDASHLLVGSEDPEGEGEPIWSVALPPAQTGTASGPGTTNPPTTGPPDEVDETAAPAETGCRIGDPGACLDDPSERFSLVAIAMVAVLIGVLAVVRRRRR